MWNKLKAFFSYSRTILAARLYTFLGALVAAQGVILPWIMGQDWTPVFTYLFHNIPDELRPILVGAAIAGTGELFVWLRKTTTMSLDQNVVVSQIDDIPPAPKIQPGTALDNVSDPTFEAIKRAIESGKLDATVRARFGQIVSPNR